MRVISAGYEVFKPDENMFKNIERVARVCYKSEDKICEGSAEKMVRGLIKRKHEAMLEHESLYFVIEDFNDYLKFAEYISFLESSGFDCMLHTTYYHRGVVSGNIRMWRDFIRESLDIVKCVGEDEEMPILIPKVVSDLLSYKQKWPIFFDDLDIEALNIFDDYEMIPISKEQLTDMEKLVHYIITVKFTVDRGISHEIVRHRPASFAQESTRYCNYTKDGFGAEITVVEPYFFDKGTDAYTAWENGCKAAETAYMALIDMGRTPQEARDVLPTSVKTEIVMTATVREWRHFFNLRAADKTGAAHPQMKEVTIPLLLDLKEMFPKFFTGIEPANR
jgi:thymidylate synthase (FAD)